MMVRVDPILAALRVVCAVDVVMQDPQKELPLIADAIANEGLDEDEPLMSALLEAASACRAKQKAHAETRSVESERMMVESEHELDEAIVALELAIKGVL